MGCDKEELARRRADPSFVRSFVEDAFHGASQQSKDCYLRFLLDSIFCLARNHPDRWGITYRQAPKFGFLRLNAGQTECLILRRHTLQLLVVKSDAVSNYKEINSYKKTPECVVIDLLSLRNLDESLPVFRTCYFQALSIAASRGFSGAVKRGHSPGVTRYLESVFDVSVPAPSYLVEHNAIDGEIRDCSSASSTSQLSLAKLRKLALRAPAHLEKGRRQCGAGFSRSDAIRRFVLGRANGCCEGCGAKAPFDRMDRTPYLETHHTTPVAAGGSDHLARVVALCPNCHRRAHHGMDREGFRLSLLSKLAILEPEFTELP